jgi:hypothetical protein
MRNIKNSKGQVRVIEVILASFIIIAAISFVNIFAVNPATASYEVDDLEKMGYSALHDLDQQGLLAPLLYNQEWGELRAVLKLTLPVDVYFTLTAYGVDGSKLNANAPIIYGDPSVFETSKNIASIQYSLVGYQEQNGVGDFEAKYNPQILWLQLSRG